MGPKTKMVFSRIILVSLVSPLPLLYSLGLLQRSAARIETAGDSEELLARVVDPTSSSYFLPVAGKGHIRCLENVTEHPTHGAILEMRLDKEIAATTDRGALSVWRTRTAQRGRAAETTHVFVTLSAPLTLTALAPRSVGSESAGFEKGTSFHLLFHLLFHLKYMFSNLIQNTFERTKKKK